MKKFVAIYLGIIFLVALVGIILPRMFSAKDDLAVGGGVAIVLLMVGLAGGAFYKKFIENENTTNKK